MMEFGEDIKSMFLLNDSVTYTNHGSFGRSVKPVVEDKIRLIYEEGNDPEYFFRFSLAKYYEKSLEAAAEFLGAKKENLVLVDNVTMGVNTVMKSLKYKPGDKVLINSHTYNAMKNLAYEQRDENEGNHEWLNLGASVKTVSVSLFFPIKSEEDIVNAFRETMDENPTIKIAIIDHITSVSAIVFPITRLVALCQERGILSVIDGAHAAGQIKLNLEECGADFYSGNFYKWCFAAKSSGYLWISPRHRHLIRPLVTSHGYKSSLTKQFRSLGTRDISGQLTLPTALKFYNEKVGLKNLTEHAEELIIFAQDIISRAMGTEKLEIPKSMRAPCMGVVRLPYKEEPTMEVSDKLTELFVSEYKIQIKITAFAGSLWARFSVNVYNCKEDYVKVKKALLLYKQRQDQY